MTKVYDTATDIITFSRSSSGTALRRVGYGDELVTNGDFASGLTSWEQDSTNFSVVGDELVYDASGSGARFGQAVNFTAGKVYQLTFDATISSTFRVQLVNQISNDNGAQIILDSVSTGANTVVFVANSSSTYLVFRRLTLINNSTLDNISVKEVIFDRATDPLVLFNHPDDIPRIEYGSDGSLKGLLIEEQRTNLVTHSDFSNFGFYPYTHQQSPVTLSNGVSGQTLTLASDVFNDWGHTVSVSASTDYTFSFYATSSGVGIKPAIYDISNGAWIYLAPSSTLLSSEPTRIEISFTTPAGCTQISIKPHYGNNPTEPGDILEFGGAQLEEGSFPTSYIPTSGSTVTRSPDIASIPVSAFGYNQEAGTVVVEFATLATFGSRDGNDGVFSLRDNSTDGDDLVQAFITPTDNLKAQVISGGSSLFSTIILANLPEQTQTKTAVGFTGGSYAASVDGGAAQSLSTSTTYPVAGEITELAIGEINNNGTKHLNGHIKSLSYFPRRLTDIQLQELTA